MWCTTIIGVHLHISIHYDKTLICNLRHFIRCITCIRAWVHLIIMVKAIHFINHLIQKKTDEKFCSFCCKSLTRWLWENMYAKFHCVGGNVCFYLYIEVITIWNLDLRYANLEIFIYIMLHIAKESNGLFLIEYCIQCNKQTFHIYMKVI